jgi:hypothetical protein
MKIIKPLIIIAFLALLSQAPATAQPGSTDDTLWAVNGVATSFAPLVASERDEPWLLIKVVSDQGSGHAEQTPGGPVTVSGNYSVIQQLGHYVGQYTGKYRWSQALYGGPTLSGNSSQTSNVRWYQSELFWSQSDLNFSPANRYLLCMVNEKADGQDRFEDVHLVPTGWQSYVLPAIIYFRTHPNLAASPARAGVKSQLEALLSNRNDYLALTACQLLSANKELSTDDLNVVLTGSDPVLLAACLTVGRFYNWGGYDNNAQWLLDELNSFTSLSQLGAVAISLRISSPPTMAEYGETPADLPAPPPGLNDDQREQQIITTLRSLRTRLTAIDPNGSEGDREWSIVNDICKLARI